MIGNWKQIKQTKTRRRKNGESKLIHTLGFQTEAFGPSVRITFVDNFRLLTEKKIVYLR